MEKKLRIATGIVLYVYITMHLINLAMGLHSIGLIEATKPFLTGPWANLAGGMILLASMLIHLTLGLRSLYRRNTLLMARSDSIQLLTGLLVLPLLIPHLVGTVVAKESYGIIPDYPLLIHYFWVGKPSEGLRQVLLLAVAWIHGSVGLFTWLKLRSWWAQYGPWFYPMAVIVPVLSLFGFSEAGKEAVAMTSPPVPAGNYPTNEILNVLGTINKWFLIIYCLLVVATLFARYLRMKSHAGETEVTYTGDKTVIAPQGLTLLEVSRANHIHHASLCNGRGRCGTCRVRIVATDHPLPDPGAEEAATLAHLRAPQNVRLACAFKPAGGNLTVERLLPPDIQPVEAHAIAKAVMPVPLQPEPAQ